jgi:hypothetical protein
MLTLRQTVLILAALNLDAAHEVWEAAHDEAKAAEP